MNRGLAKPPDLSTPEGRRADAQKKLGTLNLLGAAGTAVQGSTEARRATLTAAIEKETKAMEAAATPAPPSKEEPKEPSYEERLVENHEAVKRLGEKLDTWIDGFEAGRRAR